VVEPTRWPWHGYLAGGAVTLLTSRWKTGKTTLLAVLLARMGSGGQLAGLPVTAGRAVVVSEEAPALWAERGRRLGFGPHLGFLCRPFRGKPSAAEWEALLDRLGEEQARNGLDLVVIDPLAGFLPGRDENNAVSVLAALAPLHRLTAAGVAVLLLHHPRKEDEGPRGSGAMEGFADILIRMAGPAAGAADDRRRRLRAESRFAETPAERRIELTADGTDYVVAADGEAGSFAEGWAVLRLVLEEARRTLTRREVRDEWPEDYPKPGLTILWRWLERAVADGLVLRSGRRREPFRYWLPGREAELRGALPDLPELPPLEQPAWARMAKAVLRRRAERDP
jgi:hypothetical protein